MSDDHKGLPGREGEGGAEGLMSESKAPEATADDYDHRMWVECYGCGGEGDLADCFEDTCCCLNPPCCWSTCDLCGGKGGWYLDDDPDPAPMVAPAKPTQHATASTSSPAAPPKETATMSDTPEELAQEAIRAGTVAYFVDPIGWAEEAAPHLGTAVYLTRATEQAECLEGLVRHASRAIGREYIGASFFDKTGPAAPEDWRVLRDALAEANRTAALAAAATWTAKEALDRYRCAIGEITPDLD